MNILFITADQWRFECLSTLGHPQVKTPNLDQLAAQAVLFKNHYAQATPCSPSRTSLHTGMYLQNHRCVSNGAPVDNRFTNWAKEVRQAGFNPSLFGYTDTAVDPRGIDADDPRLKHYSEPLPGIGYHTPLFDDVVVDWVSYLKDKGYDIPQVQADLYAQTIEGKNWGQGGDKVLPLLISGEDNETPFMVNKCIDWIDEQSKPWVTHLSLLRPHPPFAAPEPYNEMFNPDELAEPSRADDIEQEAEQHPLLEYFLNHGPNRADDSLRQTMQHKANYFAMMTEVDDNLGRLFDHLKSIDEWDNTLIIFTSDHGEQMGDHWLMSKLGYFDQSYHIPLIIRDPRKQADGTRGKTLEGFTENVDIMPTMLEYLGLQAPSQCDGFSLISAIHSGEMPNAWREEVHWECDFRDVGDDEIEKHFGITMHQCGLSVIRDTRYKYVHFSALPALFFDLEKDPGEFNNLAEDPAYQSLMLEYAQKMLSWKMNHTDRGMTETLLGETGAVTRRGALRVVG